MKQTLKTAGGLLILAYIAIGILLVPIIGCGETEDPLEPTELVSNAAIEPFSATKKAPDTAPGAPQAVPEGTPFVKSVGYYSDWQLTQELTDTVAAGTTIYVKIVFSEPMKFKAADDATAFPILYYRVGNKQYRFKVVKHGESGEDFVSGDAKPLGGGTDDYIAKYTVPADEDGKFRVEIGKFNADLDGNNLPAYYTHKEELQLGQATVEESAQVATKKPTVPEPVPTPAATQQPETADTTPPTVLSITHYDDRTGTVITEGETVSAGTTINTEVVFSEPVKPSITYTTSNGKTRAYTLSPASGVHWRGLCKPVDRKRTTWLCKQDAQGDSFLVTVTTDTADLAGNPLAEAVTAPEVQAGATRAVAPRQPTTPEQTTEPVPDIPVQNFVDLGYTYTVGDETYPGFNPSPKLRRILATHPSAKLPHFEEAVQMIEVIDWVYRKSWDLYLSDNIDLHAVRNAVLMSFGITDYHTRLNQISEVYFDLPPTAHVIRDAPPHSRYWLIVEYLRLQAQYPKKGWLELLHRFEQSVKDGYIVGLVNPNN